jgi:hypothetical protein
MNPQAVIEEVLEDHGSEHPSKLSRRILEALADAAAADPGECAEDYAPGQLAFLTFLEGEDGEINLGFASNRDRNVGDTPSPAEEAALKARDILAGEIERSKGPRLILPH